MNDNNNDIQFETMDKYDRLLATVEGMFSKPSVIQSVGFRGDSETPKVAQTIQRQHDALTKKRRSAVSKTVMKQRMAEGWVPSFKRKV